jgi:type II secretory pathway pseudopilin PulG
MTKPSKMRRLKKPFTLLEICICIAILGLASSFLGIHAKRAVDAQRFRQSVARLKTELQKAQLLALSHQSDFKAVLKRCGNDWELKLSTDEPAIPTHSCVPISLPAIGQITQASKPVAQLVFTIYSSGRIEPQVLIGLHKKTDSIWLDLRHPLQIKISMDYPDAIPNVSENLILD